MTGIARLNRWAFWGNGARRPRWPWIEPRPVFAPACSSCRSSSFVVQLRRFAGLLLCAACSRELREELSARAHSLSTERAERIAAERVAAVVSWEKLEERDPLVRVIFSAYLAAGRVGVFEVARAVLSPDFSGRIRAHRLAAAKALVDAALPLTRSPEPDPEDVRRHERASLVAGRAAGLELAALRLSAAIRALADDDCDLRGILCELRAAVEAIRTCETIRTALEHMARAEEPRRRRRPVVLDAPRCLPRVYHSDGPLARRAPERAA